MARRIAAAVGICLILAAAAPGTAFAGTENILRLPVALEQIGAEAFSGVQNIDRIVIPEGVAKIEGHAFAGAGVKEIQLPKSLRCIDADAFSGCEGLVLLVSENSYAQLWCIENGFDYKLTGSSALLEAEGLPNYWKRHISGRIKDIFAALEAAGENHSAFFWYTDIHWSSNSRRSPAILRCLSANTPIGKTNFGGDVLSLESNVPKEMEYLFHWRRAANTVPNHHSVAGNHDDGNGSKIADGALSADYIYSFLMAGEDAPDMVRGDKFYYYIDDGDERTRYIYLDTATRHYSFLEDAAQREFLKKALKGAADGWHIVVIAHAWHDMDYNAKAAVNGFSRNGRAVLEILDAYNAREGEFAGCGARVEFCMGGHSHVDGDYASPGGIPVVITEGDSMQVRSGLRCEPGTITEAAVSAIVADYDAGKLHVIRIGRGSGRTVPLAGH